MDAVVLRRWAPLLVVPVLVAAMLLAGHSTANLPAAVAIPAAPIVTTPVDGQHPAHPGEKSPVESIRADFGLAYVAPPADRQEQGFEVRQSDLAWTLISSLQQSHVRLQI